MIINLIQDLATPHNNVLIEQFKNRIDVELKLWYSRGSDASQYQWTNDITHEHFNANIYGTTLNWQFIKYVITHPSEKFVLVGWANDNTRLLHLLFFLLRRPFSHWTDLPDPNQKDRRAIKRFMRWFAYQLLRYSNATVFGVGKTSIDCFKSWGFPERMLVNLPIFVSVEENISSYQFHRNNLYQRYAVPSSGFLLTAGSRLVFDKGYDLLIKAISELGSELIKKVKVVIVGSGNESDALNKQINDLNLSKVIQIEKWLDINDFKSLIANSDIFLHPARFDSYGGSTLGMSLGVPVIGTNGAGAAVDRINHGENGFLYEATDTQTLSHYITQLLNDTELRQRIGDAGRQTALQWHPSRGVDILVRHSI
jgi:glycosyltransferase involved in cell wall biosynthesis